MKTNNNYLFKNRNNDFDREWTFYPGFFNLFHSQNPENKGYRIVDLPHDFMIEKDVSADAASGPAMGYYKGGTGSYTKKFYVPSSFKDEIIYVYFDGVMGFAGIEINGAFVMKHHYGYTPFFVDITPYIDYDEENRITVNVNASAQPSSRWYSGAGIYRSVKLIHVPKLHIKPDGIYLHTDRISYEDNKPDKAFVTAEIEVCNHTDKRRIARVDLSADIFESEDKNTGIKTVHKNDSVSSFGTISIEPGSVSIARIRMTFDRPLLWDADNPNLYNVKVSVTEQCIFSTHPIDVDEFMTDTDSILFGIRTISVDSTNGLLINGKNVKLKGGCIHHDNGILGAVSLYDSEYRKILIHKQNGFNAVRTAHNPPSAELLRACDVLGIFVLDEAFDCFETFKQPGDYSMNFEENWREDIKSFMKRDRNHPSVIIWSTGNEIPERGGLGNGFRLATELADHVRNIDHTRPVTNAFCSFWSGLCDREQNDNPSEKDPAFLNKRSEPFVNNLDIVGYNYLDEKYADTVRDYPERVLVGTESFPKEIDKTWERVMSHSAVIGDFTWTSFDYIGEAGIGKSWYYEKGNEEAKKEAEKSVWAFESKFPWRLAADADFDINGNITPQGCFRRVVWGKDDTYIFTTDPAMNDQVEVLSLWGFESMYPSWNHERYEGEKVKVIVFSRAPKVVLYQDGEIAGTSECGPSCRYRAEFEIEYKPGILTAVSLDDTDKKISEASLKTTGKPSKIRLVPDKKSLRSDGKSLAYIMVEIVDENDLPVSKPDIKISVKTEGVVTLQGFGSAAPITDENYTKGVFKTYEGRALAAIRSGYEKGTAIVTFEAEGIGVASVEITVE